MPVKLIKAPFFNAMALIVVVLFAVVSLNSASAVVIPEGDVSRLHALELVNATSNRRQLRSSTDLATSDHAKTYGERRLVGNLEGIAAKLENKASKFALKQQIRWKNPKTPKELFTFLKLEEADSNLFSSKGFPLWYDFVKKNCAEEAVVGVMFDILLDQFKTKAAVAKVLQGTSTRKTDYIAQKLRDYQFQQWLNDGQNPESAFELLKLNELTAKGLFDSPLINTWHDFVKSTHSREEVLGVMFGVLLHQFGTEAAVITAIVHGTGLHDMRNLPSELLKYRLHQWKLDDKAPKEVFVLLELNKLKANELFGSSLVATWIRYVSSPSYSKKPFVMKDVLEFLSQKYGTIDLVKAAAEKRLDVSVPLAGKLFRLQLNAWMKDEKSGRSVYTLLGLDREFKDDSLLKSIWIDYERMLSKNDAPFEDDIYHEFQIRKKLLAFSRKGSD